MKLITLLGALVVVSAVLAGAALAGTQPVRPDDRAVHGVGAVANLGVTQPVRPDDRAGLLGVGAAQAIVAPSGRPDGRLLPDGADVPGTRPTLVLVDGDGFDWGDAMIGAFGALGSFLLATGIGFAAWRTRRTGERQLTA